MRTPRQSELIVFAVTLVVACNGTEPSTPKEDGTYFGGVKAMLDQHCVGCHQPGGIAPFSLVSYDEVSRWRVSIKDAVESRRMPPWLPGRDCNDYAFELSLSDEKTAKIVSWIDQDMPIGEQALSGEAPIPTLPDLPRVDVSLELPEPYVPRSVPDEYRCFILDWPMDRDLFVTGMKTTPGNHSIVHHVVSFIVLPEGVARYQALDDADEGPGYRCFGGPGGADANPLESYGSLQVFTAWGPGIGPAVLPNGVGFRVRQGSKIIVQMHYNASSLDVAPDQTRIEVMTEDQITTQGYGLPLTDPNWLFGDGMLIPAGEPKVVHATQVDLTSYASVLSRNVIPPNTPILLHGTSFHMHLLGVRGRVELLRANGEVECLLDIPRWDFHWQPSVGFKQPIVFRPGDQIRLECQWDNSASHQPIVDGRLMPPRDSRWGESTGDEMCASGFFVTPFME